KGSAMNDNTGSARDDCLRRSSSARYGELSAEIWQTIGRYFVPVVALYDGIESAFQMKPWQRPRDTATGWVQDSLNKLKIADPPLVVDGNYGRLTRAAVTQFQQQAGITADGLVGPETIATIQKALLDGADLVLTKHPDAR